MKKFRVKKQTNKITGKERWIIQRYGGFSYGWENYLNR